MALTLLCGSLGRFQLRVDGCRYSKFVSHNFITIFCWIDRPSFEFCYIPDGFSWAVRWVPPSPSVRFDLGREQSEPWSRRASSRTMTMHGRSEYPRMFRTFRAFHTQPSIDYIGLPMESSTAQALTEVRDQTSTLCLFWEQLGGAVKSGSEKLVHPSHLPPFASHLSGFFFSH